MLQKQSATATLITSLLSFIPRSVALAKLNMTASTKLDNNKILLQSIYSYLKTSGFSKTVKKLKSEAKLDEDEFTDTNLLDLEEMCTKHLENVKHAKEANDKSVQELRSNGSNEISDTEKVFKKKKKVKSDNDDGESRKATYAGDQGDKVNDTVKSKKKKKEHQALVNDGNENNAKDTTSEKLKKSKKKKKQDSDSDSDVEDASKKTNESKKRKRSSADDEGDDATPKDKSKEVQSESVVTKSDIADTNHTNEFSNSNSGYKSSGQKSAKKPRNGSAEPTTVKAFQRVKVDEVVIKDERLKDNSYWAKDGAESGYGAKAQEVLGQVRGKDFRHEKTKKKRGSYRGGQIDFGTHSVKFNDSDDE